MVTGADEASTRTEARGAYRDAPGLCRALMVMALAFLSAALPAQGRAAPLITLHRGLVITHSVRVAPGRYRLAASASLDSAVIVVRGDDVTVDFAGAALDGTDPAADPDRAAGVGIRVEGGHNVRILNAHVRGYALGILARGVRGLTLQGNDLSYNWKPRLYSLVEHESLVDWLSFHQNEHDEWLRYGAAIYLSDVTGGTIRDNRAEQGMNGLMMVRSDSLVIRQNDFSFDSGLGIGLYRSSHNVIAHNRLDYDVRGYSQGFYRRGQDSAGLLMYEQSMQNIVAYNSVTHGGDGLFVWAGQSTMDTGAGGVNDNLFFANDFSFAPANCMEATFSRNIFVANRLEGCEYGLWGGYSYDSKVVGNRFIRNRTGIGIEHGQNNLIAANTFTGDSTAVHVWADSVEPSDWGYPKHRDTRSRDYRVEHNVFAHNRVALRARNTSGLVVAQNVMARVDSVAVLRDTPGYRLADNDVRDSLAAFDPAPALPGEYARLAPRPDSGGILPATTPVQTRPRSSIVVDEWGPYDFRSPMLWPLDSVRAVPLHLQVLGPPGSWRVTSRRGLAALSRTSGRVPDTIAVTPSPVAGADWALVLEYRGAATTSPRGVHHAAGTPIRFAYGRFEPAVQWTARVFAWSDSTDPRSRPDAFAALLRGTPLVTLHPPRLDVEGSGRLIPGVPAEHVALEATGTVTLARGTYTLRTISDDAMRVWVDGRLMIDQWKPHESAPGFATIAGGRHDLRVQYYQIDGWQELRVQIVRGVDRSPGTPPSS